MNAAHLHLILNHFPVIGALFALGFFAVAGARPTKILQQIALVLTVIVALAAAAAFVTGEGAEETLEKSPGFSETLDEAYVEAHDEAAEIALILALAAGVVALTGLALALRSDQIPLWSRAGAFALVLATSGAMGWTAYLGGQISHPEIRGGQAAPA
jgi:uncharacterized membrane protein